MVGHARSVEYTRLESAKGLYLFHFFYKLTIYHASLATIQRLKLKGYIKQTFLSVEFLHRGMAGNIFFLQLHLTFLVSEMGFILDRTRELCLEMALLTLFMQL